MIDNGYCYPVARTRIHSPVLDRWSHVELDERQLDKLRLARNDCVENAVDAGRIGSREVG